MRRCGLEAEPPFNITLHTLRHTFGSWAAISGASMRAIQKLMGHNSIVTTERYAHLSADSLAAVARNLGAFVTNPVTTFPNSDKKALPGKSSSDLESWCPGRESNSHVPCGTRDFKSPASAIPPPGLRESSGPRVARFQNVPARRCRLVGRPLARAGGRRPLGVEERLLRT